VLAAKRCKKEDCGAMVVEENKLTPKSEAVTDSETMPAPKHDKCYYILN
jgi:hypothetical protein